jgi:two-component system sensor histidine kinase UhpB
MIRNWPIQTQMYSIMGTWLGIGAVIFLNSLLLFSNIHLHHEREPVEELGRQLATAIQSTIRNHPTSASDMRNFMSEFNKSGSTTFHFSGEPVSPENQLGPVRNVPDWFTRLVEPQRHVPIVFDVPEVSGSLQLKPDMSADIFEKWVAFVAAVTVPLLIAGALIAVTRKLIMNLMRPLLSIRSGITDLRAGEYNRRLEVSGPVEVLETANELNALSETLISLRSTNLSLNRKLLTVQETERNEIAKDLHDELGPLLFALRANTAAVVKRSRDTQLHALSAQLTEIAEAIQKTNRRILDRLSLTTLAELGFAGSIAALVESPAVRAGQLTTDVSIDPALETLDELSASTIYRLVQESLTNALRHSSASRLDVRASLTQAGNDYGVQLMIYDNGVGYPASAPRGRGISGMEERLHALGGRFSIAGSASGTSISCFLPISTT